MPRNTHIPRKAAEYNSQNERIYCVCRDIDDGTVMVQCQFCKDWFHDRCITYNTDLEYTCDSCHSIIERGGVGIQNNESSVTVDPREVLEPSPLNRKRKPDPTDKDTKRIKTVDKDAEKALKLRALAQRGFTDTFTQIFMQLKADKEAGVDTLGAPLNDDLDLDHPELFAEMLEKALFDNHSAANKPTEQYKQKFRTLQFNLKNRNNTRLRRRIFAGGEEGVSILELVTLPSEELASEKFLNEAEQASKSTLKSVFKPALTKEESKVTETVVVENLGSVQSNPADEPSKGVETQATMASKIDSKPTINQPKIAKKPRESLESLLSKMETPKVEFTAPVKTEKVLFDPLSEFTSEPEPPQPEISMQVDNETSVTVNAEAILANSVWRGLITMPQVASFKAAMIPVAGTPVEPAIYKEFLNLDSYTIAGRVSQDTALKYIKDRLSQNSDLSVLELHTDKDKYSKDYKKLVGYLGGKSRFGVLNVKFAGIKDIYLCPWVKGAARPVILDLVKHETNNAEQDMLYAIVIYSTGFLKRQKPQPIPKPVVKPTIQKEEKSNLNTPIGVPFQVQQDYSARTFQAIMKPRTIDPKEEELFRQGLLPYKQPDIVQYFRQLWSASQKAQG